MAAWGAHLARRDDALVSVRPLLERAPRFADLLDGEPDSPSFATLRRSALIGRPLGAPGFMAAIGRQLGRVVTPGKRGPKPKGGAKQRGKRVNKGLSL